MGTRVAQSTLDRAKALEVELSDIDWDAADSHVFHALTELGCSVYIANSLILKYHSVLLLEGLREPVLIALEMMERERSVKPWF